MKTFLTHALLFLIFTFSVQAEHQFILEIEVPQMSVSEYHAPYVATWIESQDRTIKVPTSLWYDNQTKWLKDIRQWWRKTGRYQKSPYDGVTGATRKPGRHKLKLNANQIVNQLKPGDHVLLVEAAREVGGREVLQIPFSWPVKQTHSASAQGTQELGLVTLKISK